MSLPEPLSLVKPNNSETKQSPSQEINLGSKVLFIRDLRASDASKVMSRETSITENSV